MFISIQNIKKFFQCFKITVFTLFLWLIACSSSPSKETANTPLHEEDYVDSIETFSDHTQKYDGPYNVLEVAATLINSQVIDSQIRRQTTLFQWNKEKVQSEQESKKSKSKEKTEVFISFYTPDKKSGDLLRSDTLWKIILKTPKQEIIGTPKKLSLLPIEIKSLYPRHNRWSTPYIVSFEAPLDTIETQSSELILTGPVGVATLKFPALNFKE